MARSLRREAMECRGAERLWRMEKQREAREAQLLERRREQRKQRELSSETLWPSLRQKLSEAKLSETILKTSLFFNYYFILLYFILFYFILIYFVRFKLFYHPPSSYYPFSHFLPPYLSCASGICSVLPPADEDPRGRNVL